MATYKSRDGLGYEIVWFTKQGGGDSNKPCHACGYQQNVPRGRSCDLEHQCPAWQFAIGRSPNAATRVD